MLSAFILQEKKESEKHLLCEWIVNLKQVKIRLQASAKQLLKKKACNKVAQSIREKKKEKLN